MREKKGEREREREYPIKTTFDSNNKSRDGKEKEKIKKESDWYSNIGNENVN